MRIQITALLALLGSTMLTGPALAQVANQAPQERRPADMDAAAAQPQSQEASAVSTGTEGSIAEVVVTARKRAERLQDVPLTVSAVNAARLEEAKVTDISDLSKLAPSVMLVRNTANPTSLFPWIRGFGTKASDPAQEPPIAVTIDGIYQAQLVGAFVPLVDVEAVEILRGPQGTLVGRNSPAGAVSIRTRRPGREFGASVALDYSSFENVYARGYVDIPLIADKLFATFSASKQHSDGYMRNTVLGGRVGGVDTQTYRAGLLADIGENVVWYVTSQLTIDQGEDSGVRNISTTAPLVVPQVTYAVPPGPSLTCTSPYSRSLCTSGILPQTLHYTTRAARQPHRDSKNFNVTSNLDVGLGAVDLAVVTGYRRFRELAAPDIDGTELAILDSNFDGTFESFSHEMRIASSTGGGLDLGGRLKWLAAVYYFHNQYSRTNRQLALGSPAPNFQEGKSNSYAIFGNAEYEILSGLSLSAGARYTWDRKHHSSCVTRCLSGLQASIDEEGSWNNFSYDLTANYKLTPDNMIYARYATGYRGGGFTGVPATVAASSIADPETVKSYEVGSKNDFFDHRLRVNLAVFRNDFNDLQRVIAVQVPVTPFFVQRLLNVAQARTQGVELEVIARPLRGLTLRGNVGYLDAKYTNFTANITGDPRNPASDLTFLRFPYVSKWSYQLGATYEADLGSAGSLSFSADWDYRSRSNVTDLNYLFAERSGFGLLSGNITWRDPTRRISVSVFGRNLTDKYFVDGGDPAGGLTTFLSEGPPREVGVSVGYKF